MFSAAFGVDIDFAFAQMRRNWKTNFPGVEFCEKVVTFFSAALFAAAIAFLLYSGFSIEVAVASSAIVSLAIFGASWYVLKVIKIVRDFFNHTVFKLPFVEATKKHKEKFRTRVLQVLTPPAIFALAA